MKIRRKRTEEAEEALAGGLSKANIFMSFWENINQIDTTYVIICSLLLYRNKNDL